MKPDSVLETVLYANDLDQAQWFYHEALGLNMPKDHSELMARFRIDERHVLLVFDPTVSDQAGRPVPSHGARGPGHIAFQIRPETYDDWLTRFGRFGIAIEHEHVWEGTYPGRSIYVRDPSGNSVELITTNIWGV